MHIYEGSREKHAHPSFGELALVRALFADFSLRLLLRSPGVIRLTFVLSYLFVQVHQMLQYGSQTAPPVLMQDQLLYQYQGIR